jgi:hypothetical protein
VESVLMDEETLLAHRDVWARNTRLTAAESAVYESLGNDSFGPAVRLEQELINWGWALAQIQFSGS